jgi:hypothetical protein
LLLVVAAVAYGEARHERTTVLSRFFANPFSYLAKAPYRTTFLENRNLYHA